MGPKSRARSDNRPSDIAKSGRITSSERFSKILLTASLQRIHTGCGLAGSAGMVSVDKRATKHITEETLMKVKTNLRAGRRNDGRGTDDGPNHH
jgi:hypothetical protein